jgi:hypothetical protein
MNRYPFPGGRSYGRLQDDVSAIEAQLRLAIGDEAFDAIPDAPGKAQERRKAVPRRAASGLSRGSARGLPRPPREKCFGVGRPVPLDREAKCRIATLARALMHPTEKGKHYGMVTAKAHEVLKTLLWVFHNVKTGWCFPSYEKIAEAAHCHRDTVAEAIAMLERAGILTWCNRLKRVVEAGVRKVVRTSNSYRFNDPGSKSEIPIRTDIQVKQEDLSFLGKPPDPAEKDDRPRLVGAKLPQGGRKGLFEKERGLVSAPNDSA